jgi:hypothetical protein
MTMACLAFLILCNLNSPWGNFPKPLRHPPLTTRRATRMVLKQPSKQTDDDTQLMAGPQRPA